MCIVHKGFRGFQAVSHASNLGVNLTGLRPAVPYAPYTQRYVNFYLNLNCNNIPAENISKAKNM